MDMYGIMLSAVNPEPSMAGGLLLYNMFKDIGCIISLALPETEFRVYGLRGRDFVG